MVPNKRKISRALLASVISLDLPRSETRVLVADLRSGTGIAAELARLLELVCLDDLDDERRGGSIESEMKNHRNRKWDVSADSLMQLIIQNRMTKGAVIQALEAAGGSPENPERNAKASIRDILQRYLKTATEQDVARLWNVLSGPTAEDPYLKGIGRSK